MPGYVVIKHESLIWFISLWDEWTTQKEVKSVMPHTEVQSKIPIATQLEGY
jgi:hypothetical protein